MILGASRALTTPFVQELQNQRFCPTLQCCHDSSLSYTGRYGHYWSVNPRKDLAFLCDFDYRNEVNPGSYDGRAAALSVRCVQEL